MVMRKMFSLFSRGLKRFKRSARGAQQPSEIQESGDGHACYLALDHTQIESLPEGYFSTQARGDCTWKTIFSSPVTKTDSLTVGMATCKASTGFLGLHRHRQAEIYYIISGHGLVQVDGERQAVTGGSVVFIAGDAEHGIQNTSDDEDLKWLYCFGVDGFDEVKYRFKNEAMAVNY